MAKVRELGNGLLELTFESEDPFVHDVKIWYTKEAYENELEFDAYVKKKLFYGDDN